MGISAGLEHIIRENESLAPYTRLRMGGPVEYLAEPTDVTELTEVIRRARQEDMSIRLLGGGTNLLVKDEGVPGLVINLAAPAFCKLEVIEKGIQAGGGVQLSHMIATAVREGFSGPEQLAGVPGTVGGALHGNSGTHAGDIGQWCHAATVVTRAGEVVERTSEDLSFAYRQSSLNELVILDASFQFESEPAETLTKRMQKLWIHRQASQPSSSEASAYVFRDPSGVSATSLIEQAGMKGTKIGEVEICDKDPNFIVAHPGATSADFLRLVELMKTQVHERTGVELELNLEIW